MADLASSRIHGDLTVTRDIAFRGKITGDGSGLSNISSIEWVFHNSSATVSSGQGIIADTSTSSFTITLPSTPSNGDVVAFVDFGNSWGTNNLTVNGNGNNVIDASATLVADVSSNSFQLVFYNSKWVFASV